MIDPDSYTTPAWLCTLLGIFDLDPCSNPHSLINARHRYGLENGDDGQALEWFGRVWCNPPYSDPRPWCRKMIRHGQGIMLLKLDPTVRWYADLVNGGATIYNFRKRLRFGSEGVESSGARWPCMIACVGEDLPIAIAPHCWITSQK